VRLLPALEALGRGTRNTCTELDLSSGGCSGQRACSSWVLRHTTQPCFGTPPAVAAPLTHAHSQRRHPTCSCVRWICVTTTVDASAPTVPWRGACSLSTPGGVDAVSRSTVTTSMLSLATTTWCPGGSRVSTPSARPRGHMHLGHCLPPCCCWHGARTQSDERIECVERRGAIQRLEKLKGRGALSTSKSRVPSNDSSTGAAAFLRGPAGFAAAFFWCFFFFLVVGIEGASRLSWCAMCAMCAVRCAWCSAVTVSTLRRGTLLTSTWWTCVSVRAT
jgi:hypothetical protein